MVQQQIIAGLEARARAAGVSISSVCARAGIAASTFSRWKPSDRNPNPIGATLRSLDKLSAAMTEIEQERVAQMVDAGAVGFHAAIDSVAAETTAAASCAEVRSLAEPELPIGLLDEEPALPLERAA